MGQNPTFATTVSKEEAILGDKAVGGMDDDKGHVNNVKSGLKALVQSRLHHAIHSLGIFYLLAIHRAISNPETSAKARDEAERKLKVLEGK